MYNLKTGETVDKNGGKKDYENKIIRTYKLSNLSDDYLRMLRAYRFSSVLGFKLDESVFNFIKENASKLENVSKERINQELIKTFQGDFLPEAILNMDLSGILEVIFPVFTEIKKIPPNSHHHLDLFHHSVETVKNIRINKPELKIAALLHDLAKPDCWTIDREKGRHRFIGHDEKGGKKVIPILKRLKFSNRQIEYISKMIKYHIYPSALMASPDLTEKAIIRFVRKIGGDTMDLIELARADRLSAKGKAVTDEMVEKNLSNLEFLKKKYEEIAPKMRTMPKLTDGNEIMQILEIPPSPILKEIIEEIKELQLEGIINTKKDAKNYILSLKSKYGTMQ
ncbi:MAG: HD domain-containing protein, partial [Candidatus Gastranaerophilales bacterium]|nr:HD domain-containing protein [Candidatus Gastranaerophilales bacterium]